MEKIINKKLFAGLLAVSTGCLLASCQPVKAVPSDYTSPIVVENTEEAKPLDFEDNILGTLYDSIASNPNPEIVEQIIKEKVTELQFGTYEDFLEGNLTGKYFNEEHKKEIFVEEVTKRISEYFYNEVVSGSYNDELGRFSEEKMYNAHRYEVTDLKKLDETEFAEEVKENKFFATENLEKDGKEDIFGNNILKGDYKEFIEKKVYPGILKDLLVEDYIFRENPLVLGRTYATKVSYVKIAYDDESHVKTRELAKAFANAHIEDGELDFEVIADALKGFTKFDKDGIDLVVGSGSAVEALLKEVYGESESAFVELKEDVVYQESTKLLKAGKYYKETKIGEIVDSFNKAIDAENAGRFPIDTDKTELDKFTADGPKELGLLKKLVELAKEDCTKEGWFTKNGGAGELPSAITERLFRIKVSQDIDEIKKEEAIEVAGEGPKAEWKSSYLRNVNGNTLILAKDAGTYKDDAYNYIYDDTSSSMWIAKVEEAVSPAKFNELSSTYLGKDADENRLQDIGRAIAKVLSNKGSYTKETYTSYLNEFSDVLFYDSSLYDYFKAEYPDLDIFEEE